jgi:2-oxoglutarate ferredoxin oxidoreductase subunit beta
LGKGVKEDDLLFHDEKAEPTLAYLLSRMTQPHFPEPMGVLRAVEAPTYDGMAARQVEAARQKGSGSLEALFNEGDTWEVK